MVAKGGVPRNNSKAVIPRDQISAYSEGKKIAPKHAKKYFVIIRIIQNHLRSHPARSANEGLGLTLSSRKLADSTSDSKVGQTNVAITINQNVTSFDITTHNDFVRENTDE